MFGSGVRLELVLELEFEGTRACTVSVNMQWEREDAAFIRVSAMRLCATPPSKSPSACSASDA